MEKYNLNYNRNLVNYLIKARVKQNKPIESILKDIIKKGYKHIKVTQYEQEIKRYIVSMQLDDNETTKNISNEKRQFILQTIEYIFDNLENNFYCDLSGGNITGSPQHLQQILNDNNL